MDFSNFFFCWIKKSIKNWKKVIEIFFQNFLFSKTCVFQKLLFSNMFSIKIPKTKAFKKFYYFSPFQNVFNISLEPRSFWVMVFWNWEKSTYKGQIAPAQTLFHKSFPIDLNFSLYGRSMGNKKSVKFLAQKSNGCLRYRVLKLWVSFKAANT